MPRPRTIAFLVLAAVMVFAVACSPTQVQRFYAERGYNIDLATATAISAELNRPKTCREAVDALWPAESRAWFHQIVKRESGGNARAQNKSSSAAGCAQLLRIHAWRFDAVGCSWAQRYDAECNVKAALHLYRAAGKSPWRLTDY